MDVAIGVGRPVVEDEFRPPLPGLAQALIKLDLAPAGEQFRLLLRQAGAHRKIRLRQIEAFRIIRAFGLLGRPRLFVHLCKGLIGRGSAAKPGIAPAARLAARCGVRRGPGP